MPASTLIVDTLDGLDAGWFTAALRAGGAPGEPAVSAVRTGLIGTGQLGLVARAQLEYDPASAPGPGSVVVKLPSRDPTARGLGVAMGVYEAEVRFYRELAPTVGVRSPRLYAGEVDPATGRFTLAIEDLAGFGTVGDMIAGGTVAQASSALAALAQLQAGRWCDPALRELPWLADLNRTRMLFAAVEPALEPFLARFGPRLEPEQIALLERTAPLAMGWAERFLAGPAVVVHGDYRMDNLMFPPAGGAAAVLDWQVVRLGPPLVDACVYLGGCLSAADRRAHERDLLREYHARLVAAGVGGFSFDDCWASYRWCVFWGFFLSAAMALQLEQSERGDDLFAGMFRSYADHVVELDAEGLLGC
jgi:hypothetical protein